MLSAITSFLSAATFWRRISILLIALSWAIAGAASDAANTSSNSWHSFICDGVQCLTILFIVVLLSGSISCFRLRRFLAVLRQAHVPAERVAAAAAHSGGRLGTRLGISRAIYSRLVCHRQVYRCPHSTLVAPAEAEALTHKRLYHLQVNVTAVAPATPTSDIYASRLHLDARSWLLA